MGDHSFNGLNGHRRLLFYDTANERRVDVFVGRFEMCHTWPGSDPCRSGRDAKAGVRPWPFGTVTENCDVDYGPRSLRAPDL